MMNLAGYVEGQVEAVRARVQASQKRSPLPNDSNKSASEAPRDVASPVRSNGRMMSPAAGVARLRRAD